MFIEDYQEKDLPSVCTTFFERLNRHILDQKYTEKQDIHYLRNVYHKKIGGGVGWNIYYKIYECLQKEFGAENAKKIYLYLTEHSR